MLEKTVFKTKEEKELNKKRRRFYLQFLKSGDVYYDVGANYGNRIEPIINEGIKIIAVEPQAQCIDHLKSNYGDKITVIPNGLAESKGVRTMFISNAHTISSFSRSWIKSTQESGRFSDYNWNKEEVIEMETLDNLISRYGNPQFVKIDVEGYEYEVLKGLSHPIKVLSFEYTTPERKSSIIDCINRIVEIGKQNEVLFNYSIGESMEWTLDEWISAEKMKAEIKFEKFTKSGFGDIYAKTSIDKS